MNEHPEGDEGDHANVTDDLDPIDDVDGQATRTVPRTVWNGTSATHDADTVVCEEPLELRVAGVPLAVVMRTPGHDIELAWGFLRTERIVDDITRVVAVRHCTTVEHPEAEDNIIQITLAADVELDLARLRRNLYASSSCGICGKATLENVLAEAPPIDDDTCVATSVLSSLPDQLRAAQTVFATTGGLHGAALFDARGQLLVVREDVGRHNAVDKVIGWATMRGTACNGHVLMVSGRVSYEIVQKALAARIPIVAAVSAPSSLAIDLATRANLTLVGFVRGDRSCVYAGTQRVTATPSR